MLQSKDVGAQKSAGSPAPPLQGITGWRSVVSVVPAVGLGSRDVCQEGEAWETRGQVHVLPAQPLTHLPFKSWVCQHPLH